jgi:hypothetical protein
MAEQMCPHCNQELKLIATSETASSKKTTQTNRYRCPVSGCGFTHTERTEQEGT